MDARRRMQRLAPALAGWLVALAAPVVAYVVRVRFAVLLGHTVWLLFNPAVIAGAWLAGLGGGIAATLLGGGLAFWYLVPPVASLAKDSPLVWLELVLFVAVGVFISVLFARFRRTEQALRESHADLAHAQRVAAMGSWRLDVKRNRVVWSEQTHRMLGVAPDTRLTFETFMSRVHPDDRDALRRSWDAGLHGELIDLQHRIVVDGEVRWVHERAELERDGRGEVVGALGTLLDITAIKQAEETLRAAHERTEQLRLDLERLTRATVSVSEAVAEVPRTDVTGVLHMVALQAQSLAHAEYVAIGVGTDPTKPFDPWVSIGLPQHAVDAVGRPPRPVGTLGVIAGGEVVRADDVRRHPAFAGFPEHHPVVTSLLGVPIRYHGRTVGNLYLGNKRDAAGFTEQDERLVEMLAARAGIAIETATHYSDEAVQRAWLQTLIDQMPEGVIFLDAAGSVVLQNRMAQSLARPTGRKNRLGKEVPFDLRTPDGAPLELDALPLYRAVVEGSSVIGVELAIVGPDDQFVPVLVSATPVRSGTRVEGAVGVFQDISAIKELERRREEWASLVAHDLRQPLSAIALSVHVLERASPDSQARALARIQSAMGRMNRMIDDLLDASRIESSRLSLVRRPVDVGALARELVDDLREATAGACVEVVAGAACEAFADPERVEQVLGNLVSNAVKYGDKGAPIRVEVAACEAHVEVSVTNRGAGIPVDQQPLLFNRFVRARAAREGKTPGLGLGLYIAHGLVQAHGGRMWFRSVPGETTSFHFTLPRGAAVDERAVEQRPTVH